MTAKEHRNILGILFLVHAGLQLFGGVLTAVMYGGMGAFMMSSSNRPADQTMGGVFLVLALVVGGLVLALGAVNFIAGWKLFKGRQGARIWGIVASCISLIGFPLGTILGVYGLWFFFGETGKNLEADGGNTGSNYPPPPPNSWS